MYCDIPQVNQLTALLLSHGLTRIVACPGSRNATLLHNFREAGFTLYPATDERSAAFVALGIVLATEQPAAVCVTSGSALLATLPAVAEASYRHLPLLVISADRPAQWVGQYDGQTLPQCGALQPYCPTCGLSEPHTEELHWANNRLINEALCSLHQHGGGPAHLNVPIAEPMFSFTTPELPTERTVSSIRPATSRPLPDDGVRLIAEARLPALVMGQYDAGDLRAEVDQLDRNGQLLVLPEILSDVPGSQRMNVFDALPADRPNLLPDVVIHVGGNFVHKRFKQLLRTADCRVMRIGQDRELIDTFCHLTYNIACSPQPALHQLAAELPSRHQGVERARQYFEQQVRAAVPPDPHTPAGVLLTLRHVLQGHTAGFTLHLANSTAVRAAAQVFSSGQFPILCNRGTNGIEGSLSTAVGYALEMWGLSIVVIGDLSFFYDANALWNTRLPSNLRILLLNNHGGGIFHHLPGLEASPALPEYIAAGDQSFSAEGIAHTFHIGYLSARADDALEAVMRQWLQEDGRARLLEIFLNAST